MLTDAELDHVAETAADAGVEVSLFARPGASWGDPPVPGRRPAPRSRLHLGGMSGFAHASTTRCVRRSTGSAAC